MKVVLSVLFIGGGIYFIKKILPILSSSKTSFDIETNDYEDELAKNEADRLAFIEYQKQIGQRNKDGSYNSNWWINPKIKFNKEDFLIIYPNLRS
jgi:hypothetical protein